MAKATYGTDTINTLEVIATPEDFGDNCEATSLSGMKLGRPCKHRHDGS